MNEQSRRLRLSQLDRALPNMLNLPSRPIGGWISSLREALDITLAGIGRRIGTTRQAVLQLEQAEAADRITLGALRKVASAMGCDLVYALVPKSGSFVELAERPTRDRVAQDVKSVMHTMMLEGQKPENADQLIEGESQRRLQKGNR